MILNKRKLVEGKIDSEYQRTWSSIDREIFDRIIALDPQTKIDTDFIGPSSKQLLLPRYAEGETDFLDNGEAVTSAIATFIANRGSYPQTLRNISNFPSVKDFVEYIQLGDESNFAQRFDLNDVGNNVEKENKLDKIYNKFYKKDIPDRDIFNKIINLDPDTTETSIGPIAKNFLLPKYIKGEDFLPVSKDVEQAIGKFLAEKDSLPADKRNITSYESVKDFCDYMLTEPDSELLTILKAIPNIEHDIKFLGSTSDYDIMMPLTHRGNNLISNLGVPKAREHEDHKWCTGWTNYTSQWESHSRGEYIYCFMYRKNMSDRLNCYQLAIYKNNYAVCQFLNGEDEAFGRFNAGSEQSTKFFEDFLLRNPDVTLFLTKIDYVKQNPTVQQVTASLKYLNEPFVYTGTQENIDEFVNLKIGPQIEKLIIQEGVKEIPSALFSKCSRLNEIQFAESLEVIGAEAFMLCTNLKKLVLPSNLKEIKAEAFADCTALKGSVRVPNSLERIGRNAFRGCKCVLSIDKSRTTKIKCDPNDKAWFISHHKLSTFNESLEDTTAILVNEDIELLENIPPDLARAYKKAYSVYGTNRHAEIGNNNRRRQVSVDYKNSNYEELSKDAAMEYLAITGRIKGVDENGKNVVIARVLDRNLFNPRIVNLRFLVDGQVAEFAVSDSGNRLIPVYSALISESQFGNYPKFNDGTTTSTSYLTKYSDFYILIQISDKIYKTDENEHMITGSTPTGKKIKVARKNPDGSIAKDDDGNIIYDIIDDTIWARRTRNNAVNALKSMPDKNDSDFIPHKPYDSFGRGKHTRYAQEQPDTGSHSLDRIYTGSAASALNGLINALKAKQTTFKKYDYARKYLKKIKDNEDLYEPEEFTELVNEWEQKVAERKAAYEAACDAVRVEKQKVLTEIDEVILEINKRLSERLKIVQTYTDKLFNNKNAISELTLKVVVKDSKKKKEIEEKIKRQENQIQQLQSDIESYERDKENLLRRIRELEAAVERGTISIQEAREKLNGLLDELQNIDNVVIEDKFAEIDRLEQEQQQLQDELDELSPRAAADRRARAAKNRTKEVTPEMANYFDFEDEEEQPEESPEEIEGENSNEESSSDDNGDNE